MREVLLYNRPDQLTDAEQAVPAQPPDHDAGYTVRYEYEEESGGDDEIALPEPDVVESVAEDRNAADEKVEKEPAPAVANEKVDDEAEVIDEGVQRAAATEVASLVAAPEAAADSPASRPEDEPDGLQGRATGVPVPAAAVATDRHQGQPVESSAGQEVADVVEEGEPVEPNAGGSGGEGGDGNTGGSPGADEGGEESDDDHGEDLGASEAGVTEEAAAGESREATTLGTDSGQEPMSESSPEIITLDLRQDSDQTRTAVRLFASLVDDTPDAEEIANAADVYRGNAITAYGVVSREGGIMAVAAVEHGYRVSERTTYVHNFIVDAALRAQGHGRALLRTVAQQAAQRGNASLMLSALDSSAEEFFAHFGFRHDPAIDESEMLADISDVLDA